MCVTQLLKGMKTETNLLVFTETCMWLMVWLGSRSAWPEYKAIRIARLPSINSVNKKR